MKKIVSILLIGIMALSLVACGGGSASSGSASSKAVKSSLKGDFMFYKKSDGVYFTDNNDIPETFLIRGDVRDIYIDEKRMNIVFANEGAVYIKSLKNLDEEAIEITDGIYDTSMHQLGYYLWNNQTIIWHEYLKIFTYDLESKKKERISENVAHVSKVRGDSITFFERNDKILTKMVVYNIKRKSKVEQDISELELSKDTYPCYTGNIAYVSTNDGNIKKIYKLSVDSTPVLVVEGQCYTGADRQVGGLGYDLKDAFPSGELFYQKIIGGDKTNGYERECYCYDGKNNKKLDAKMLRSIDDTDSYQNLFGPDAEVVCYTGLDNSNGFITNKKTYSNKRLISISSDGGKILFHDNEDNKDKILNINNGEIIGLENNIMSGTGAAIFDNNNLLYLASNNDLIFNNEVIDYNVKNYGYSINEDIKSNNDLSMIVYRAGDNVSEWKNGNINIIINKANRYFISNNSKVYYTKDNNLYLYKDNESKLIAENVENAYDYKFFR